MSGGWIANFVVGVVLLLVTPLLNGIMQHPRIAILSAVSGLTIIIWVVALAGCAAAGAPTVSTTQQEGKLEPLPKGHLGSWCYRLKEALQKNKRKE
jgi:hypothetical protein